MQADIKRMLRHYGFSWTEMTEERLQFRLQLLEEEVEETVVAVRHGMAEEVVDGLTDTVVIALGTLELLGVDVELAWQRVMAANMQKVRGRKPGRESDGWDLTKPEGWVAPEHGDNVGILPILLKENSGDTNKKNG